MPVVGEPVVDRHARGAGEFFEIRVIGPSVLDGVEKFSEDTSGIGDRLLVADLRGRRIENAHMATLIAHGDLERHLRTCRGLLEDERQLPTDEPLNLSA